MHEPSIEQIRNFRLHSHYLDAKYELADIQNIAGACGLQNTPPGAWETALYNRLQNLAEEYAVFRQQTLLNVEL